MKTKNLIFVMVVWVFSMSVTTTLAQTGMFDKLSDNKDITTVYVSKALLGMAPDMNMNGMNVKNLANKLEQIEVYTSENKNAMDLMKSEAKSLIQNKKYEVLMAVKEKDQHITFYGHKENGLFKDLVMLVDEINECVVIRLLGTFTMEDIQKISEKTNK